MLRRLSNVNRESLKQFETQIREIKEMPISNDIDMQEILKTLEDKVSVIKQHLDENLDVWDKIQISRFTKRPTTLDFIHEIFDDFVEIHGDRLFGDDPAIVGGIATLDGIPVTVLGNQKGKNTKENIYRRFGMSQPEGYRKALRIMQQANKFKRPIVTFINTAGAFPGKEAEERGQSEAIARNLREMANFGVPIICFVIGEGGSGGALALGIGNKLYMLENTFYSVISPEGAAALLWKDSSQAQKAAQALKVTAQDLFDFGIVDKIIEEPRGGAQMDLKLQSSYIKKTLKESLNELSSLSEQDLIEQRYEKFRQIGEFEESLQTNTSIE